MDYFAGIGEVALSMFPGMLVFALVFSALGWILRSRSDNSNHHAQFTAKDSGVNSAAAVSGNARELLVALRSTQYKLDSKEAELREFRQRSTDELLAARERIESLRPLKQSLKDSQAQILKLTEQNHRANRDLSDANETLEMTTAMTIDASGKAEMLDELRGSYEELSEQRERDVNQLHAELKDLRDSNQSLVTNLAERDQQLAAKGSEAENGSALLAKQQTELESLRAVKHEFEAQQSLLSGENDDSTRLADAESKLASLQKDINDSQTKLQSNQAALEEKEHSRKLLESAKAELTSQLVKVRAEKKFLDDTVEQLQTEQDSSTKIHSEHQLEWQSELTKAQSSADSLQQQCEQLEQKQAVLNKEKSNLQENCGSLETRLTQSREADEQHQSQLDTLREESQRELATLKKRLEDTRKLEVVNKNQHNTLAKLETQLHDMRGKANKLDALQNELIQLRTEKESSSLQLKEGAQASQEMQKQHEALKHQLTQAEFEKNKVGGLQRQLQQADEKNHELRQRLLELEPLRQEITVQKNHIENVEKSKTALTSELEASGLKLDDLSVENVRVKAELHTLQDSIDTRQARVEHLEAKCAGLIGEVERGKSHAETAQRRANEIESLTQSQTQQNHAHSRDLNALTARLDQQVESHTAADEKASKLFEKNKQQSDLIVNLEEEVYELKAFKLDAEQLQIELNENRRKNNALLERVNELDTVNSQLGASKSRLQQAKEETHKVEQQLETLAAEHQALKQTQTTELGNAKQEQLKAEEEKLQFEQQLHESVRNNKALVLAGNERAKLHDGALGKIAALSQQVKDLEKQTAAIAELNATLSNTQNDAKHLKTQVEELTKKSNELNSAKARQQQSLSTISKLETQAEELTKQKSELQENNHQLQKTAESLADSLTASETDSESRLTALFEKNKQQSAFIVSLEETQAVEKQNTQQLQDEFQALNDKLKETSQSKQSQALQLASLEQKIRVSSAQTDQAEQKLQQQKQEHALSVKQLESKTLKAQQALQQTIIDLEQNNTKLNADNGQSASQLNRKSSELDAALNREKSFEQEIRQLEKANTQMSELRKALNEHEQEKTQFDQKLHKETEKSASLQTLVKERQTDIERLQTQINRLSALEIKISDKDNEIKKLKEQNSKLKQKESRVAELEIKLANAQSPSASQAISNGTLEESDKSNALELKRLNSQVGSLIVERDLGLERVKELSAIARSVEEKEKHIRELKASAADSRLNDRELNLLRQKSAKQDSDLRNKNTTIESLRRQLSGLEPNYEALSDAPATVDGDLAVRSVTRRTTQLTPKSKADALKPAREKTASKQMQTQASPTDSSKLLFKSVDEVDDLKEISGIGPAMETLLNSFGITSFRQIAELKGPDIEKVSQAMDTFPGRIERDNWVSGAAKCYVEKYKKRD